jgi:hypothetical protein
MDVLVREEIFVVSQYFRVVLNGISPANLGCTEHLILVILGREGGGLGCVCVKGGGGGPGQ